MVDITVRGGSHLDFNAGADLKRVTVDSTSTTVTHGVTTVSEVTVGAYTQTEGTLDLSGTFTAGGPGLTVDIGVDVSGSGDFNFVDGTFIYSAGNFGGSGALNIEAGDAQFQAAGGILSRATTVKGTLELAGAGAVALDSQLDAWGDVTFGDDATITAGPLGNGLFNIHALVTFGTNNEVDVTTVSLSDALWPIMDTTTYASVKFTAAFNWPTNATWTGHDSRNFVYWSQDFGNGTTLTSDFGNAFIIVTLDAVLDTTKYNCHSPVDHVVYLYDGFDSKGQPAVIAYPVAGAGKPFDNNHAYVTCNDKNSVGPQATLTLYSGASTLQSFGLFLVVALASLFF